VRQRSLGSSIAGSLALVVLLGVLAASCAPRFGDSQSTSATGARPSAPNARQDLPSVQNQPAATLPAVPPTDRLKLRFGGAITPPAMVHLGPYVARAMGFFDDVGLDVDILSFDGGIGALRASKFAVDVVGTSGDPLFQTIQNGQQFRAIGAYAARLSVVMMSGRDVKSTDQLKGRKIGIPEVGGFNQVMAQLVLERAGISPDDVQWVNIAAADRLPAIVDGRIDGSVLHIEQYYAAANAAPELNVLARLWEVAPEWWYSAFVAPQEVVDTKREALIRFMTAVIRAQRFMYTNPVETKRIAVEVTRRQPQDVDQAYDDLARGRVWSVNDGMPRGPIEYTIRRDSELGVIRKDDLPTYDQIVEQSIVEEAISRNGGRWSGDARWQ